MRCCAWEEIICKYGKMEMLEDGKNGKREYDKKREKRQGQFYFIIYLLWKNLNLFLISIRISR